MTTPRPEALTAELLMDLAASVPGSCDWGGCDNHALLARFDAARGWLPVCQWCAGTAGAADLAPITALPLGEGWDILDRVLDAARATRLTDDETP